MNFQKTATFFLVLFMGILVVATYVAVNRKSGNTGMDMGKMHLMRVKGK